MAACLQAREVERHLVGSNSWHQENRGSSCLYKAKSHMPLVDEDHVTVNLYHVILDLKDLFKILRGQYPMLICSGKIIQNNPQNKQYFDIFCDKLIAWNSGRNFHHTVHSFSFLNQLPHDTAWKKRSLLLQVRTELAQHPKRNHNYMLFSSSWTTKSCTQKGPSGARFGLEHKKQPAKRCIWSAFWSTEWMRKKKRSGAWFEVQKVLLRSVQFSRESCLKPSRTPQTYVDKILKAAGALRLGYLWECWML